jgi:hypothetical protein
LTTTLNASTAGAGGFIATSDNSGSLALQTAGTTAVTIDTSQRVGIGTTPSYPLDVRSASTPTLRMSRVGTSGQNVYLLFEDGASTVGTGNTTRIASDSGAMSFSTGGTSGSDTGGTERMRIDSSGNLLVGTTTSTTEKLRIFQSAANNIAFLRNSNATTVYGIQIEYSARTPNTTGEEFIYCGDTAPRFTARSNGGIANYSANNVNLSDRREKTNFAPATSYLNKICAIPVQTFNYIDQNMETDGGLTLGVVAQDVQAVAPELVSESNWASRDAPEKMRLSIYQTDLQYALMKSIQELKQINDTQAETINALTARIVALETA